MNAVTRRMARKNGFEACLSQRTTSLDLDNYIAACWWHCLPQPGLVTFLWYKPPPTALWRAFNKTQSSNGQNRGFLPTIRQWQLYFIWSINLSLSYLQFCVSNCLPVPVLGGINTNLNPQSLMTVCLWPDLRDLNSSPWDSRLALIMGDWSRSQVSLPASDSHLIVMWYSDTRPTCGHHPSSDQREV